MTVPKINKHKNWKKKHLNSLKCLNQFPDCPEEPNKDNEVCRVCPFLKK